MPLNSPLPKLHHISVPGPAGASGGERRMAYWEWPAQLDADDPHVVICVHGLSRQGRDFDSLAAVLSQRARVLAVDVAGRGHSDWLADPMQYQVPIYAADVAALIAQVRAASPNAVVDWVGTSMGGLMGMGLAAQKATGIRRLVLNDVGPVIQWASLQRIGTYLGMNPSFESEQAAIAYLASISAGFGPHTPDQWRTLSLPMLRERDGRWWLHYDPALAEPFKALTAAEDGEALAKAGEATLWGLYDAIECPTLLLRGAESDLLSRDTAKEMGLRGPRARCIEFEGVGHAPTLVTPDQIDAIRDFLWTR
ncbi:MAG: alpha/beta hydrolase [Burkholderiaceae bacterium]